MDRDRFLAHPRHIDADQFAAGVHVAGEGGRNVVRLGEMPGLVEPLAGDGHLVPACVSLVQKVWGA